MKNEKDWMKVLGKAKGCQAARKTVADRTKKKKHNISTKKERLLMNAKNIVKH